VADLDALRAEYKALLESWEYAFAMGHGCSIGDIRGSARSGSAPRTCAP